MTTRSLVLQADTHFRLPFPGRWRLSCVQGRLWITRAGDLRDHVLQDGDSGVFQGSDALLIGALQESRLRLEWLGPLSLPEVNGLRARLGLLLRRCWASPASRFYTGDRPQARRPHPGHRNHPHRESGSAEPGVCGPFCEKLD